MTSPKRPCPTCGQMIHAFYFEGVAAAAKESPASLATNAVSGRWTLPKGDEAKPECVLSASAQEPSP